MDTNLKLLSVVSSSGVTPRYFLTAADAWDTSSGNKGSKGCNVESTEAAERNRLESSDAPGDEIDHILGALVVRRSREPESV